MRSRDGDTVEFGNIRLEVIHLVGHTPGSIALLYDDPEGPRTYGPATASSRAVSATPSVDKDAFATLIEDVSTKVFDRLPDETWFYPGTATTRSSATSGLTSPEWRDRGW